MNEQLEDYIKKHKKNYTSYLDSFVKRTPFNYKKCVLEEVTNIANCDRWLSKEIPQSTLARVLSYSGSYFEHAWEITDFKIQNHLFDIIFDLPYSKIEDFIIGWHNIYMRFANKNELITLSQVFSFEMIQLANFRQNEDLLGYFLHLHKKYPMRISIFWTLSILCYSLENWSEEFNFVHSSDFINSFSKCIEIIFAEKNVKDRRNIRVMFREYVKINFEHIAQKYLAPRDSDNIAHYTSVEIFRKIFDSKKLKFSQKRNLNDNNEGKLLWDFEKSIDLISFTSHKDQLSLWNNYTNYEGVSIVFKPVAKEIFSNFISSDANGFSKFRIDGGPVIYGKDKALGFKSECDAWLSSIKWLPSSARAFFDNVVSEIKSEFTYFFKDNAWKYESEYRILLTPENKENLFEQNNKYPINNFEINENNDIFNTFSYDDVKEVVLSPKVSNDKKLVNELKKYVRSKNKNIKVIESESNINFDFITKKN